MPSSDDFAIAVVMPAHNAAATIADSLRSACEQKLRPTEIIVIDDGSTDETPQVVIAAGKAAPVPITLIRNEQNIGIARSLNRGVAKAISSQYIARLDADDQWTPEHLQAITGLLQRGNIDLCCSRARYVDPEFNPLHESVALDERSVRRKLLWDNPIVHSSVVFRKSAFQACGGYAENVKWEDYDLWIKLLKRGSFACTNRATTIYKVSATSLSRGRRRSALEARWRCQKAAFMAFWRWYPLTGSVLALVARARLAMLPD